MPAEKNRSKVEIIKENSNQLRGTISEQLSNDSDNFDSEGYELLKFYGIYQQDNRDERQSRKKEGKGKKYIFMIRTKNPGGGELTSDQWIVHDYISDKYGNGNFRITTRQDIQFHGIGKNNLKETIKYLNKYLIPTYGACGDLNRNTVADPISDIRKDSKFNSQKLARLISEKFNPKSNAYYDIWLDGEPFENIKRNKDETEYIYGNTYLPRKFKIGIAQEIDNSVDVHTNDIGIIAVIKERIKGFNILVGGGLGSHHRQPATYPRLATPLAFVTEDKLLDTLTRIVEFQRDNGDRSERKHARLKYIVEEWGIDKVKRNIEKRLGYKLTPPFENINLKQPADHYGWHEQDTPGLWYLGLFIENGRIQDTGNSKLKTGLREIIKQYKPDVRLSPLQDLILINIKEENIKNINSMLEQYGIKTHDGYSRLRLNSMSCPALPTCGLALAESERYMPSLLEKLEKMGYGNEDIKIRMSGCPNACSRPTTSEIGIMGASPGKYNVYLGGDYEGTRLNTLYDELVEDKELPSLIGEIIDIYRKNKIKEERLGDFCSRIGNDKIRSIIKKQ
ncbi:MAG: NADPH-dependent assimilatory sulfite reductase hemoprotein subunit [Thermodesulfobacteriota bacterium]